MNHQDQHSQDTAKIQIGVFCHKCGKEDFSGNTQSLSSHIRYCKPTSLITSSSINTTKRKHQQDNPSIQFHDAGTDPFSFLARKRKHFPNSLNLVTPKTKKVPILGTHAAVSQSSSIFNTTNGKVNDLTLDTSFGDVEHLFSDLLHSTSTNPVYDSPSYQAPIVDTSLVPTKESELAFDLNGPMPGHCQFQLDLLNSLPPPN